jgi:hypothetical protein
MVTLSPSGVGVEFLEIQNPLVARGAPPPRFGCPRGGAARAVYLSPRSPVTSNFKSISLVAAALENPMSTIETIESAIRKLPPADLAEFRRWFAEFDAAAWDAQTESDAAAGKLDALAEEALAEYRTGKAREL